MPILGTVLHLRYTQRQIAEMKDELTLEVMGNLRFPLDITYHGCPQFGDNGDWQGIAMAGLNDDFDNFFVSDTMTFEFSSPVSGVGGFLNYSPGSINPVVSVYDANYALIEFAELSFSTGGGLNTGMFYGFLEQSKKIKYFTLTDANIGITDLTLITDSAPVPEPATMLLMGTGLAGMFAVRRKKKA